MELSRRDLFKFGGIAAVGAAGAGMLAGCSPSGGSSKSAPAAASKDTDGLPTGIFSSFRERIFYP